MMCIRCPLGFDPGDAISDLVAGVTVGLATIPQSIFFAAVSGVSVQSAVYSSLVGSLLYPLLGHGRELTVGPTPLLAGLVSLYVVSGASWELLSLLSGALVLLCAVLRVGSLVNRLSPYVLAGLVWGQVVLVTTAEMYYLMGIRLASYDHFRLYSLLVHLADINPWDVALSSCCISVIVFLRTLKSLQAPPANSKPSVCFCLVEGLLDFLANVSGTVVIVIASATAYYLVNIGRPVFTLTGICRMSFLDNLLGTVVIVTASATAYYLVSAGRMVFTSTGQSDLEAELPDIEPPPLFSDDQSETWSWQVQVMTPARVAAMSVLAHAAVLRAFSSGEGRLTSWELTALGLVNVAGSFCACAPMAADVSRSAANSYYGARSRLAGFLAGVMMVLYLTGVGTPCYSYIPRAAVSSVIVCALGQLARGISVAALRERDKRRMVPGVVTFLASLFFSAEIGALAGVVLDVAICTFCRNKTRVVAERATSPSGVVYILVTTPADLKLPTADMCQEAIARNADLQDVVPALPVVVDCSHISMANLNASHGLYLLLEHFGGRETQVIFHGFSADVAKALTSIFPPHFLSSTSEAQLMKLLRNLKPRKERSNSNVKGWDPESQTCPETIVTEDANC